MRSSVGEWKKPLCMEDFPSYVSYICESDNQGDYDLPSYNSASSSICNRIKSHLQQNLGVLMSSKELNSITIPLRVVKNNRNENSNSSTYTLSVGYVCQAPCYFYMHLSSHNSEIEKLLSPY